eukprot:scaffold201087_cov44-Prasinocladus_malaysianus.AAC.1
MALFILNDGPEVFGVFVYDDVAATMNHELRWLPVMFKPAKATRHAGVWRAGNQANFHRLCHVPK